MQRGMDVARLSLAFGTIEGHAQRIQDVRSLMSSKQRPVGVIADLPGRKPRIGFLSEPAVRLETGDVARFVPDEGQNGDARCLPVPLAFFSDNMMRGDPVLLSDGVVELVVTNVGRHEVEAEVVYGGMVGSRSGIHTQGMRVEGHPITEADEPYLRMCVDMNVDYLALSYVADDQDILVVRERLAELGRPIPIIAKIERAEAFARLDGILRRADAVMIRRGDLGAQIEITRVPLVQKDIMRLANRAGVPVIIATQMLGSMIRAPRPTRAEASDVSNAIADGADGVLLSSETAIGEYPVEAVDMMSRIVRETESEDIDRMPTGGVRDGAQGSFAETTASVAVEAADRVQARIIVCFSESGRTARLVSKYRPDASILAFCKSDETRRRLALPWGVRTDKMEGHADVEEMVAQVEQRLLERNLVRTGDQMVLVFGSPMGVSGRTNTVRLHRIGGAPDTTERPKSAGSA